MEDRFKEIAALVGDPVRATIMWTLLDGKAFTATELAIAANTSAPNISMHLSKLVRAALLTVEAQGRHRYYKFAGKEIAYAIEAMANLVSYSATKGRPVNEIMPPIRQCRTCYDHLAGKTGVAVTDSLLRQKLMVEHEGVYDLTNRGKNWFKSLGIDAEELQKHRRSFIRPCLDWSERRYHIAGSLAAALLDQMLLQDWIRRTKNSRAVVLTAKGQKKLYDYLGLSI